MVDAIERKTEQTVRRFIELITNRYEVAGAIVYGSRARGTHTPDSEGTEPL